MVNENVEDSGVVDGIGVFMPPNEETGQPVKVSKVAAPPVFGEPRNSSPSTTPAFEQEEVVESVEVEIVEDADPSVEQFNQAVEKLDALVTNYDKHVVGQQQLKETLLIGLLTGGHVLLESVPGLAKTTAAQTLALSIHGSFNRIQCTPDLLPSDIIGTEIFDQKTGSFKTELGPVHANFVLLDEINRSSAKTQSAMLEAMQEKQTSIGGVLHKLPTPFQVIATQNPIEHEGTYPLPEAQLDRFLMKDVLTYSSPEEEYEILQRFETGVLDAGAAEPVISVDDVLLCQKVVKQVYVNDSIYRYVVNLVVATRAVGDVLPQYGEYVEYGASTRASIALLVAAKAVALLNHRNHVLPEDVKHVAGRVLQHRITLTFDAPVAGVTVPQIIDDLLGVIPTP